MKEINFKKEDIFILPTDNINKYIIYSPLRGSAFFATNKAKDIIIKKLNKKKLTNEENNSLTNKRITQLLKIKKQAILSNNHPRIKYSSVVILLTDDCNLRCSYCYSYESRKTNTLKKENLFNLIKQVYKEVADEINPRFTFMGGGEPLVRWKLLKETVEEITKQAKRHEKTVEFSLVTNGTLLNEEKALFLKKYKFGVSLSFDILPEFQNKQRPSVTGNSFDKIDKGIKLLTSHDIKFSFRSTITLLNVKHQREMVEFAHKNYPNIKKIHLEPATSPETGKLWEDFIDYFMEARALGKEYNINVKNSISNSLTIIRNIFCSGEFTITSEGNITSCHRVISDKDENISHFKYGKLNDKGFFIDNKLYKKQKDELRKLYNNSCDDCFARFHCAGFCPQAKLTVIDNNLTMNKMCGYTKKLLTKVIEQDLGKLN